MVQYRPPEASVAQARKLRLASTRAEQRLWYLLRRNFPDHHFRRQAPLRNFHPDFISHRSKLVIEADGGQHSEIVDEARTTVIETEGYRVRCFWNNEILQNPDGVLTVIAQACTTVHPHPTLPHQGGGKKDQER